MAKEPSFMSTPAGRPCVERPDRGQDPKSQEQEDKRNLLNPGSEGHAVEGQHVKGIQPGAGIEHQDAGDDETAAGHEVKGQLHGGVDLAGGAPDEDKNVHGHHSDLVKQEKEKHVVGHENAEHPGNQGQLEDEILPHPGLELPHGQDAGKDNDTGKEQEWCIHAFHAHEIGDAEGLDPGDLFDELQAPQILVIGHEGINGQEEADPRGHQGDHPDQVALFLLQKQEDEEPHHRGQQHTAKNRERCQVLGHI
jgi:hypothetical protein